MYARVSVAVLFYKLSDLVGSRNENGDCCAALESGKLFLLELLESVVLIRNLYHNTEDVLGNLMFLKKRCLIMLDLCLDIFVFGS